MFTVFFLVAILGACIIGVLVITVFVIEHKGPSKKRKKNSIWSNPSALKVVYTTQKAVMPMEDLINE
jgi:hypothetical protein